MQKIQIHTMHTFISCAHLRSKSMNAMKNSFILVREFPQAKSKNKKQKIKREITMTTETMKQNLINSIIDEDADNPYKKRLLKIMKNYDKGELTDIESYLLINDILTRYDFDVIMPKENEAIKEARKSYELSDFICNPEDATEVAIKTKTEIGQIFQKGRKEFIRTIGVENLNMKDREGNLITDINKVSKGKRSR